jgi:hypothetical protein
MQNGQGHHRLRIRRAGDQHHYEILTLSHLYRDAENAFDELNGAAAGTGHHRRPPHLLNVLNLKTNNDRRLFVVG